MEQREVGQSVAPGVILWTGFGVLAIGTWMGLRQDLQQDRPLTSRKRRIVMLATLSLLVQPEVVQSRIDRLTRVPNLGLLIRAASGVLAASRTLAVYDDLMGASQARRAWHRLYSLGVVTGQIVCWWRGLSDQRSLRWQFLIMPLEDGNRWRAAFAFLSLATLGVQATEGMEASRRIVVQLYASRNDRALCLRSLCYGVSWVAIGAFGVANSAYPVTRLIGCRVIPPTPLVVRQGLILLMWGTRILGGMVPRWRLGPAGSPTHSLIEVWTERTLRTLYLVSCYEGVQRLAFIVQDVVPARPLRLRRNQTHIWQLRSLDEITLLLQLHKTIINDARLVLLDYVEVDDQIHTDDITPYATAQALTSALRRYRQAVPSTMTEQARNPLCDAASFNDERFLAAVARACDQNSVDSLRSHTRRVLSVATTMWTALSNVFTRGTRG